MALMLSIEDYAGPTRWRWQLTEAETGRSLADHQVDLAPHPDEYAAFTGLYQYLRWNAVPDRRTESEAEIVTRIGSWAGAWVLGEAIGQVIVRAAPVTVRVAIPEQAGFVLGWPLELAHVAGEPLAARGDVTFVYDVRRGPEPAAEPAGRAAGQASEPVRMLAVFSLPTRTSVLALRRERYELARLIRRITARDRRRVELTILQYGVTRRRLADMADAGDGWDVLHLSGHGGAETFLLESEDGSPDPVSTADLVGMLRPLRRRVRLAVVSACESGAATTAETLRWVGLGDQADKLEQQDTWPDGAGHGSEPEKAMTGIARALETELGCAVLAMRYPVTDDFAIAFTGDLYERLLGRQGQALGTAVARALPVAAGPAPSAARPAICLATPVLAGAGAAVLTLHAAPGAPELDPAQVRMERFPPEPERFVGRTQAMAAASAALAAGSGRTGVLLHGMAGSGKTAAALELAYRHQDSFGAVAFWQAPERDDEFGTALEGLAMSLDIQLGGYGFAMADKTATRQTLEAFLPRLRALLEATGILLVLDNLETLLTPGGSWRDVRWEPLLAALTSHRGESRVILTSRIVPAPAATSVLTLPVHALSLEESAALARELPGLRSLLHADASPLREADQATVTRDRDLVRRVLRVVQGHPKLMELADGAATDPAALRAQLDAAERITQAGPGQGALDAFFRAGVTSLDASELLDALSAWTAVALDALPDGARLMAQALAFCEDDDRRSVIIEANWPDIWQRMRPGEEEVAWEPMIDAVVEAALVQAEPAFPGQLAGERLVTYRMHPGVSQAIRAGAESGLNEAVDSLLAVFWVVIANQALGKEGGEAGQVVVQASLNAAPYLVRLRAWNDALTVLQYAASREGSPVTSAVVSSYLRTIADATGDPIAMSILGRALTRVNPVQAERVLRTSLAELENQENWVAAGVTANDLINLLQGFGQLRESLELAGKKEEYTRKAGLGQWTQLADRGLRLQILGLLGEHQQVLDQIPVLLAEMAALPEREAGQESIMPWNVREATLDIGRHSAQVLGRWQQCLDLNAAILASLRARGAGEYEIAYSRFNDSGPLQELGRLDEADQLLAECQQVYEDHGDIIRLARALMARANVQSARGNGQASLRFAATALRYAYIRPEPGDIAMDHFNFANRLRDSDRVSWRAHRLAATMVHTLTGMAHEASRDVGALAREMAAGNDESGLPVTLDEVIAIAEQTEGVRLGELITALQPSREAAERALAQILADAQAVPSSADDQVRKLLQQWEPVIADTAAAAYGNQQAAADLAPFLDEVAQLPEWAALVTVLRRITAGERGLEVLDGLDETDSLIVREILSRLGVSGTG